MAILRYVGDKFVGLASDTKPTGVQDGAIFYESDTQTEHIKVGGAWLPISAAALTGIEGTGVPNYLAKWVASNSLDASSLYQDSNGNFWIGDVGNDAFYKLHIIGRTLISGSIYNTGEAALDVDGSYIRIGDYYTTNKGGNYELTSGIGIKFHERFDAESTSHFSLIYYPKQWRFDLGSTSDTDMLGNFAPNATYPKKTPAVSIFDDFNTSYVAIGTRAINGQS